MDSCDFANVSFDFTMNEFLTFDSEFTFSTTPQQPGYLSPRDRSRSPLGFPQGSDSDDSMGGSGDCKPRRLSTAGGDSLKCVQSLTFSVSEEVPGEQDDVDDNTFENVLKEFLIGPPFNELDFAMLDVSGIFEDFQALGDFATLETDFNDASRDTPNLLLQDSENSLQEYQHQQLLVYNDQNSRNQSFGSYSDDVEFTDEDSTLNSSSSSTSSSSSSTSSSSDSSSSSSSSIAILANSSDASYAVSEGWSVLDDFAPVRETPSGIFIVSPNVLDINLEPPADQVVGNGNLRYFVRIEEIVPDALAREE